MADTDDRVSELFLRICEKIAAVKNTLENQQKKSKHSNAAQDGVKQLNLVEWRTSIVIGRLEDWKRTWEIKDDLKENYWRDIWGESGHKQVKTILKKILELLDDQGSQIESLAIAITPRKKSIKHFGRKTKLPPQKKSQDPEAFDLVIFVKKLSHEVDKLVLTSDNAFRTSHTLGTQLTNPNYSNPLIAKACDCISASKLVFLSCASLGVDCTLNIERNSIPILRNSTRLNSSEFESVCYGISTFASSDEKNKKTERDMKNRLEQYRRSLSSHSEPMGTHECPGLVKKACIPFHHSKRRNFYVCLDSSPIGISPNSSIKYNICLERSDSAQTTKSQIKQRVAHRDRVDMACRFAQATLFLLCTPWLAFLRSDTVYDLQSTEGTQELVLKLKATSSDGNFEERRKNILSSAQLHTLGIILIEIALGRPTKITSKNMNSNLAEYAEELAFVNAEMGYEYCEAASFCLRTQTSESLLEQLDDGDEELQDESHCIISAFYLEVIYRLKKMQGELYA